MATPGPFGKRKSRNECKESPSVSDDEPDWLASQVQVAKRAPSTESEDPFDLMILSASQTEKGEETRRNQTQDSTDVAIASTSRRTAGASTSSGPSTSKARKDTGKKGESEGEPLPEGDRTDPPSGSVVTHKSSVTIKIPEKLTYQRLLVELPEGQDGSVDLNGDAGAVGRIATTGPAGQKKILLDLKGVIYDVTCASLPCTAVVVNINNLDAKVEAICNEFVQLEQSALFRTSEVLQDGNIDGWMLMDQDDHTGTKDGTETKGKGKGKKDVGDLGVSSGKVVKVAARKKSKPGTKSKGRAKPAKKAR